MSPVPAGLILRKAKKLIQGKEKEKNKPLTNSQGEALPLSTHRTLPPSIQALAVTGRLRGVIDAPLCLPLSTPNPPFPSPPSIMAAGVIAAAWGWQREPPSISLTTNSQEDGWRCAPQLISIYKGGGGGTQGGGGGGGGMEKERKKITEGGEW